jgi:eukaryotic-like serine/threonine-protein kinase
VIGTLLNGRFRLEEQIGSGGMSTVYRAFDETLERWVAIKLMHGALSGDPLQHERFRREARSVARLSHPHLVTVIDAGEDDGHPYIVFEYVEGETLKHRIRELREQGRAMPVVEAVAYAIEVGRALSAAHAQRVIHRDVKPQNVLIDPEGRAKVTDFGIARTLDDGGLTATGRVLGTTDYVSPEQALGEDVGAQSDIYSLGICLYEMLTSEVPFKAESQVGVAMKHVRERIPDVQRLRPEVSAALAVVIERATAKERGNRYSSIDEMVSDLEQALTIEVARAGEASGEATTVLRALPKEAAGIAPGRLRRPHRFAALVALTALAGVALALALTTDVGRQRHGPPPAQASGPLTQVSLTAAHDYDPYGTGNKTEHPTDTGNVLDADRQTTWSTEQYSSGDLGKPGVGIYVDTAKPLAARRLDIRTPTPGFLARIYGSNAQLFSGAGADTFASWGQPLASVTVGSLKHIYLNTHGQRYQHYLVWIFRLPPGMNHAEIAAIRLLS